MDRTIPTSGTPKRVFNFSPGPAVLPLEVLQRARDEMLSLPGVGISVLEVSHRSPPFDRILEETINDLRTLLGIGGDHEVVLLQGGASLQFSMVPMNLLRGQPGPAPGGTPGPRRPAVRGASMSPGTARPRTTITFPRPKRSSSPRMPPTST
jgi:hypothetical protein